MKRIYLDYAALTPTDPRVLKEVLRHYDMSFGNPSSLHKEGVAAKKVLDDSRALCANILGGHKDEIVFTGSGTEANNLAIFGTIDHLISEGKKPQELHVITSVIEHPSVLECMQALSKRGVKVDYIKVHHEGLIDLKELEEKITRETCLVSIMHVNNEVGVIEPLEEIVKIIRNFKKNIGSAIVSEDERVSYPLFHTDASQAPLYIEEQVQKIGCDLLTLDAHKVYGPKGVGMLWVKRGVALAPQLRGGNQESGRRASTENIPGIAGFAKAMSIVASERTEETARLTTLRDYFINKLLEKHPQCIINGARLARIANNINFSIPGIDNEFFVLQLDAHGVACSTKSSCLRDDGDSYVLDALVHNPHISKSSLRISLGRYTKKKDIDSVAKLITNLLSASHRL